MIYAKILCDSLNTTTGDRLTTMEIEYPLYVHNELLTHRCMSKSSASSRAIPVAKRLQRVIDDPVIPTEWPKNEPGMSASAVLDVVAAAEADMYWRGASRTAVNCAKLVAEAGVHKQIANRIVEPWVWMKTIVSSTAWENFFSLRCARDAHPDLQELAWWMLDALCRSTPRDCAAGDWHIPFGDQMPPGLEIGDRLKIATARCARISYLTQDGLIDTAKDIELHDRLLRSGHMVPFEHCACAAYRSTQSGNFTGWHQYRKSIPGETRTCNLNELWVALLKERTAVGKAVAQ